MHITCKPPSVNTGVIGTFHIQIPKELVIIIGFTSNHSSLTLWLFTYNHNQLQSIRLVSYKKFMSGFMHMIDQTC